jgi:hypothetical protein
MADPERVETHVIVRRHGGRPHQTAAHDRYAQHWYDDKPVSIHGPVITRVSGCQPLDKIGAALLRRAQE